MVAHVAAHGPFSEATWHLWSNRPVLRLVLLLAPVALLAQSVWASPQTLTGNARTVLAAVVDTQGQPVVDVALDDFVVTEGASGRDVIDVHVADYPLAIVLDDRAAVASSIPAVRAAARRFIQRVGERPVALVRMTDEHAPLTTLEDDRATVLTRLDQFSTAGTGTSGPLDTIARAAALLAESGAPFSAVVVIAAGPVDASAPVRGELLPQVIESGAAVHVVQAQAAETESAAVRDESDLLRVIADQSRGQFTAIFSTASFTAALDRLADRLAIEMMVQYLAPAGPRVGDVRVGVRKPGARVIGLGVK